MTHIFISFTNAQVRNVPAAKVDFSILHWLQPCQSVNKFGLSVSIDACNANDLSCTYLERDVFDRIVFMYLAGNRHMFDVQDHFTRLRRFLFDRKSNISTDHHAGKLFLAGIFDVDRSDILSLAQDGATVGNFHDLIQLMGNKENRLSFGCQTFHDLHQFCNLLWCQDCCRFIENQNFIISVKHFEDFGSLLHTNADILDQSVCIHIQSVFFRQFVDFFLCLCLFQKTMFVRLYAQNDIIKHGKALNQLEVLVYHADPQFIRDIWVTDLYFFAILTDLASLRLV